MTKQVFLWHLGERLAHLPDHEREKTLAFYGESIDDRMEDGMTEEAAVADVGTPEEIARAVLVDTPLGTLLQTRMRESHAKAGKKGVWVALAICGFPLWFPLLMAFVSVGVVLFLMVWVVVICLFSVLFALGVTAIAGLVGGVFWCVAQNPLVGMMAGGMGLVALGLFLLGLKPILWLSRQFIGLTVVFLRKIKSLVIGKKEEGQAT